MAVTGNLWWPLGFPNPRQTSKAIIKKLENTPKEHLNDMRMLQIEVLDSMQPPRTLFFFLLPTHP